MLSTPSSSRLSARSRGEVQRCDAAVASTSTDSAAGSTSVKSAGAAVERDLAGPAGDGCPFDIYRWSEGAHFDHDYYGSTQMEAALNCSDWTFLLRQKAESIELLAQRLYHA